MAYQRSGPTFTFMGVDRLNRTVSLFPDIDDRAAVRDERRPRRPVVGGCVSMTAYDFGVERRSGRLSANDS